MMLLVGGVQVNVAISSLIEDTYYLEIKRSSVREYKQHLMISSKRSKIVEERVKL